MTTWYGVFVPGESEAMALFRDADEAQAYRKRTYGADASDAEVRVASLDAEVPLPVPVVATVVPEPEPKPEPKAKPPDVHHVKRVDPSVKRKG